MSESDRAPLSAVMPDPGSRKMSRKLILWLVVSIIFSTWYVLDPEAGGHFFSGLTQQATGADAIASLDPQFARSH